MAEVTAATLIVTATTVATAIAATGIKITILTPAANNSSKQQQQTTTAANNNSKQQQQTTAANNNSYLIPFQGTVSCSSVKIITTKEGGRGHK